MSATINRWMRQLHRWLSVLFTIAVAVNGIAVWRGAYSNTLGLVAVAPLLLLLATGLYLFLLPYTAKWRRPTIPRPSSVRA